MAENNWYSTGDQIIRMVEQAVNTGDFNGLGSRIAQTVKGTAYGAQATSGQSLRLSQNVPGEFSGKMMQYLGFGAAVLFGLIYLAMALVASSVHWFLFWDIANTFGVIFAISLIVGVVGRQRLQTRRRLQRYAEVVGPRTYCPISELSEGIRGDDSFVRRDLRKMIRKGYFVQAWLDEQETCLITDQETYRQYQIAQKAYEQRQSEEQAARKQEEAARKQEQKQQEQQKAERSPEHQKMLDEGREYIRHIHECNDRIPGEEMTEKLNQLELVVSKIFQAAEKDPSSVSDLHRMMSYYLPTTQKLLDAYCDLDAQPIRGENIQTTKKEIEEALDTINTAFENLFDSMYTQKAWDISSDISVLNSMLAQEGLTGNKDFQDKSSGGNV